MKGIDMYCRIQAMKGNGISRRKTAEYLGINRATVNRYWDMTAEEYEEYSHNVRRSSMIDTYKDVITMWIRQYPALSAAAIFDKLKENYTDAAELKERTVSRYVQALRKELRIPKQAHPREYMAVDELPPGKQCQIDFGEQSMIDPTTGNSHKVRFAAFIMSHSRCKFLWFQSRPFHTMDLITAMKKSFEFFGGMTEEYVFDQDSVLCVSENTGDILLTHEFEKFRQQCKFKIYLCRAADPESKGKIERVVQYVKGNFLAGRPYPGNDDELNLLAVKWLDRTGNARIHSTTYKIPREVFEEEKAYLQPIPDTDSIPIDVQTRTVRKDNTICYKSNRYSVPIGTYTKHPVVAIEDVDSALKIYTEDHDLICEHTIHAGQGQLVKNKDHERDKTSSVDGLQKSVDKKLDHKATVFLNGIRAEKTRYARDQFMIILRLISEYGKETVIIAAEFCTKNKLFGVAVLEDFIKTQLSMRDNKTDDDATTTDPKLPINDQAYHPNVQKRSPDEYLRAVM